MGRILTWTLCLGVMAGVSSAGAVRPKAVPCAPGLFALDIGAAARIGASFGITPTALDLQGGQVAFAGCTSGLRSRATRKATRLRATWLGCAGLQRLRFRARIAAPGCTAMTGTLRAKRRKAVPFAATRVPGTTTTTTVLPASTTTSTVPPPDTCGNGVLDTGEQCEPGWHCGRRATCTPSCVCEPAAGPVVETSQVLIDDAYRAGTIDLGTALLYRAYARWGDPRLPEAFDGVGSDEEDNGLAIEITEAWPTLPASQQEALRPYVVRPNHPESVFSTAYGTAVAPTLSRAAVSDSCVSVTGCPAWSSTDGPHLRVWSCQNVFEASRAGILSEAESLYGPISAYLGEPVPDVEDNAGGVPKIDIYLVELNQARRRGGECLPIVGTSTTGQAVSDAQYLVTPGGVKISSGYIMLPLSTIDSGERKSTIAHELFHVVQLAHSVPAYASWLADATAVWAEWHFVPETARTAVHDERFDTFQSFYFQSLDGTSTFGDYHRYIWFFFAEQQLDAGVVQRLYRQVENPVHPTRAADRVAPFATQWSHFIVRNLNATLLVNAGQTIYRELDDDFPFPQPITDFEQLGEISLQPLEGKKANVPGVSALAAAYHRLTVNEAVHELTFDFSELSGGSNLDIDLLLRTSEAPDPDLAAWEQRHLSSRKVTFCRDTGDRRVFEAYVILGNHDWQGRDEADGSFTVKGRPVCCEPGKTCWTGTAGALANVQTPYGTLHMNIDANVTWEQVEGDPTGSLFQPKGSVTYSADMQIVGGECSMSLSPTTLPIGASSGQLQFMQPPGQPRQYFAMGSGVEGMGLLPYRLECPDLTATLQGDAKPWLVMDAPRQVPDAGLPLEGTYNDGGTAYQWKFVAD